MAPLHIACLGSSFAAGPGIQPIINRPAGRSGRNYAHILASLLDPDTQLTDLSVSGATLLNISQEPQVTSGLIHTPCTFPPQVEGLLEDADVVMITAGGNDLGYIGGVMLDALRARWWGRVLVWVFGLEKKMEIGKGVRREDVVERFVDVIDKVKEKAPKARILLVEYLTLFGVDAREGVQGLSKEQVERHRAVAKSLGEAYKMAAEKRGDCCSVVRIADGSDGHGIGSKEPWVEGFGLGLVWRRKAPYHPNEAGMKAIADILFGELKRMEILSSEA